MLNNRCITQCKTQQNEGLHEAQMIIQTVNAIEEGVEEEKCEIEDAKNIGGAV